MASRSDLARAQEKIRLRADLLTLRVKKMDLNDKIKIVQDRLKRIGGR